MSEGRPRRIYRRYARGWMPLAWMAAVVGPLFLAVPVAASAVAGSELPRGFPAVALFVLATTGCAVGVIIRHELERLEVSDDVYGIFDWRGRLVASFRQDEVCDIRRRLGAGGRRSWTVILDSGSLRITDGLDGVNEEMGRLERLVLDLSRARGGSGASGKLDGVYRWVDTYQNRFGVVLFSIALLVVLFVCVADPPTALVADAPGHVALVLGLVLTLLLLSEPAAT